MGNTERFERARQRRLLGSLPRKNTHISIDMEREPLMPPGRPALVET